MSHCIGYLVIGLLIALCSADESDLVRILRKVRATPEEDLSPQLRDVKEQLKRTGGDNSHWCCASTVKPVEKDVTRLEAKKFATYEDVKSVVGYEKCDKPFGSGSGHGLFGGHGKKKRFLYWHKHHHHDQTTVQPITSNPGGDHTGTTNAWTIGPIENYCPIYHTVSVEHPYYKMVQVTVHVTEDQACPATDLICCAGFKMLDGQCYSTEDMGSLQALIDAGLVG